MAEQAPEERQHLLEEIITCAEELHTCTDLQEYIYDCARELYVQHPGQSYHVLLVSNAREQHAELVLANGLALEEVKVIGATVPVRTTRDLATGSTTRRTDRESMEMLLLECKQLLADHSRASASPEESISIPKPQSLQDLRENIFENARKCFPDVVEYYTTGAATYTVTERDRKYRPKDRKISFVLPESEVFDIAITAGRNGLLKASLVYGDCQNGEVNFAIAGQGRNTHYEAIEALSEVSTQRVRWMEEGGGALEGLSRSGSSPPEEADYRRDSPMTGYGESRSEMDGQVVGEKEAT